MKLDEIHTEWENDCLLDETKLSEESLKIPKLHAKYLRISSTEKILLEKIDADLKILIKYKVEWFLGIMGRDTLKELGWEPFQLVVLKSDIPMNLDADIDIQILRRKLALQKQKVSVLDDILKNLAFRNSTIKNSIDYQKLMAGLNW